MRLLFAILGFLVASTTFCQAQTTSQTQSVLSDDSLLLSVSSYSPDRSSVISFTARLSNMGKKNIFLPDRFITGDLKSGVVNLGYELFYCELDSIDILANIMSNINPGSRPINSRELNAGKTIIHEFSIPKSFFTAHGHYVLRIILKKNQPMIGDIPDINSDVYSNWFSFVY